MHFRERNSRWSYWNWRKEEYQAIQEKKYLQADDLKNKINALNEEIIRLSEAPPAIEATATEAD